MIARWSNGEFDVLTVWNLTVAEAQKTVVDLIPDLHTRYIGFSADRPPFSNELVRKAFSHAIDRERLLRPEDSERAATRGGAIPPAMPGHSHRIGPEHDLELARTLLAHAGYPEGRGLPRDRTQGTAATCGNGQPWLAAGMRPANGTAHESHDPNESPAYDPGHVCPHRDGGAHDRVAGARRPHGRRSDRGAA